MNAARTIRLARHLVTTVVVLIVATLGTVVWISTHEMRVQRRVYADALAQRLEATQREFRLLLRPFDRSLHTLAAWQETGLLPLDDPGRLAALVVPVIDPSPQIAVVAVVPDSLPATLLVRDDDGWRTVRGDAAEACRTTSWSTEARDSNAVVWSGYTSLPAGGRSGMMAARRAGPVVLGLGVLESDLDAFVAGTPLTANGVLVRRYRDGTVAWLSPQVDNRLAALSSADLLTSTEPEHVVIADALRAWGGIGQAYRETFRFRSGGRTWWGVFYPQAEGSDPGDLGLIAPSGDLDTRLARVSGRVTWLMIGVAALAMVAIVVQAFAYRSRWQRIARRRLDVPADEAALAALVAEGEGARLEFKSTMRWNLHADKPGKEMELAWLKTVVAYLNSDGGFLVLGVADDGAVVGVEADQFANDDKYRLHFENLIARHVGLEFAGRIRGEFRALRGGRVFLVSVGRSDDPAFLRRDGDEEFYVRVGPSSRKLPASRLNDWIRDRRI